LRDGCRYYSARGGPVRQLVSVCAFLYVLLDRRLEFTLDLQNKVDRIAAGAVAAFGGRYPVRRGAHLRASVSHRHGESTSAHYGQVDYVIAQIGHLHEGQVFFC